MFNIFKSIKIDDRMKSYIEDYIEIKRHYDALDTVSMYSRGDTRETAAQMKKSLDAALSYKAKNVAELVVRSYEK